MPELPEVETTKQGIRPYLINQTISAVIVRHTQLRLPISPELHQQCVGQMVSEIKRRGKYLIIQLSQGYLLIHLGMTGHLRILPSPLTANKHDHIDVLFNNGLILRYHDPRRFGLWLHLAHDPYQHNFLAHLGPEPLSDELTSDYLWHRAHKKTQNIKTFIMDSRVVVGVGNIYANESLFFAGIHPLTPAGLITKKEFTGLTHAIKEVLQQAIIAGGTTLRDFYAADGKPGYFAHNLQVYGRKNLCCFRCQSLIELHVIAGRSSAFCPQCQPLRT